MGNRVIEVDEVERFAGTPANKTRASKLRAKLGVETLDEDDAEWLAGYESERARVAEEKRSRGARAASRTRRTSYEEEEHEAVGEGEAASMAVAAGFQAREEGRRLDSLVGVGMTALKTAFDMSMTVCRQMADRNLQLERAHVDMMAAYRQHFLGRVEAEVENINLQNALDKAESGDKDGLAQIAEMLLPLIMPKLEGAGPKG